MQQVCGVGQINGLVGEISATRKVFGYRTESEQQELGERTSSELYVLIYTRNPSQLRILMGQNQ